MAAIFRTSARAPTVSKTNAKKGAPKSSKVKRLELNRFRRQFLFMPMECSVQRKDKSRVKLNAFKEFRLKNGTVIGVFQGSYGDNPDLDVIIKYQEKGKRVRTPKHIHWAIDLLIKKEHEPELTKEFVKYLIGIWGKIEPFKSKEDQQRCKLKFTTPENLKKFGPLNAYGEYPVEFIGCIIELMMLEEKTGNHEAFMFKSVLDAIYNDEEIYKIVSAASFRGSLH